MKKSVPFSSESQMSNVIGTLFHKVFRKILETHIVVQKPCHISLYGGALPGDCLQGFGVTEFYAMTGE